VIKTLTHALMQFIKIYHMRALMMIYQSQAIQHHITQYHSIFYQ